MFKQNGWVSLILFFCFLYLTDFLGGFHYILVDSSIFIEQIIRPSIDFDEFSLEKQLLLFRTYENEAKGKDIDTTISEEIHMKNKYRVYIYSSHQNEKYTDGKSVVDASLYLAEKLEELGFSVIVELNDFNQYAKKNGYSYDQLYDVSRIFLEKAIEEYGPFHYVIDLHRDGVGKANTSVVDNGVSYAKMMFVVSLAGPFHQIQFDFVMSLMNRANQSVPDIYKNIAKKYYTIFNQDVMDYLFLLELGSNNNSFDEVRNSVDVFAEVFLKEVDE